LVIEIRNEVCVSCMFYLLQCQCVPPKWPSERLIASERVARHHAVDPRPPQEELERMVASISARDSEVVMQFANYLSEIGLADPLVGQIMYLVFLSLSEDARAKLLVNQSG
jgi:hypothetical protein